MPSRSSHSEPASCFSLAIHLIAGSVILISLIPSWAGLFGGYHWLIDLFSHFRWQYLIACVPMLAWTLWRRQHVLTVLVAVTLLLNAWLIGRLMVHPGLGREALEDDFRLRVLSLNVLTSNPNKQQVLDHVTGADADFVFFMEVDDAWLSALQALKEKYPHHYAEPRGDNFGLAVFSHIPWKKPPVVWYADAKVPTVEVELNHQGRDLMVVCTHPLPPAGRHYATLRDQQLRQLAERVSRQTLPVLVMGDLNATPWSAGMRIVQHEENLGFRSLVTPCAPTWRAGSAFAIPIDHILCTAPLVLENRIVGPDVGSDHRSVKSDVRWAKP